MIKDVFEALINEGIIALGDIKIGGEIKNDKQKKNEYLNK